MASGWPHAHSPFHQGELEIQERLKVRQEVDLFGRRSVRDHMPDQHREFYNQLPFLLLGFVDKAGRPWASVVAGKPGFISSPDDTSLVIDAGASLDDPLLQDLVDGADVGVLGIDLSSRRRNRVTGRVFHKAGGRLAIQVDQTFGNCPKYIQTRYIEDASDTLIHERPLTVRCNDRFDGQATQLMAKADTFFIATRHRDRDDALHQGADVSHRGGKPGFVELEDDRTLSFLDYPGNRYFNTLGNIHSNPKAGLLFADFSSGDLLQITGSAEVVWAGAARDQYDQVGRRVRVRADVVRFMPGALPLRFSFGEYSPVFDRVFE